MAPAISLVEADPDLGDLLDPASRERARREALARTVRLSPGEWDAASAYEEAEHHRGFLIVEGLLSREVDVLGRRCVELIGPADVMRPWSWDEEGSHVRAEVGWMVLEPTKLAVLDHRLVVRINPWPQLGVELFNRGTRRAHHLAVSPTIRGSRTGSCSRSGTWPSAGGACTPTASSCRCRWATSASPTSSAPTAR